MMWMSNNRQNLSEDELRRVQAETGVEVHALLDLLERTPAERLRIATANANNISRLRDATGLQNAEEMTATPGAFDPLAILSALYQREVQFVVIGGVAGFLLGSFAPSTNLDILFAPDLENARRLALAMNDLHARAAGSPSDVAEVVEEGALPNGDFFTFRTDHGFVHCLRYSAGTKGYAELLGRAERMEIDGVEIDVASLADLIRMKEASNRSKDRFLLEALRAMQKLQRRG